MPLSGVLVMWAYKAIMAGFYLSPTRLFVVFIKVIQSRNFRWVTCKRESVQQTNGGMP